MSILQNQLLLINQTKEKELQDKLIEGFLREFTKQDYFYCVASWKENLQDVYPFVGHFQNVPCFYVFTEAEIAKNFAKHYELTNPNGEPFFLKITMNSFYQVIQDYREIGVPLIMFDEGANLLCHNISYVIARVEEIIREKERSEIILGRDKETGEKVFLMNQNRLKNTLLLGGVGSGKLSLSVLPMIYQDLMKKNQAMTVLSSNTDVLDKSFIMARYYKKTVTYINLKSPESYIEKVSGLTKEDFLNENNVLLISVSEKGENPKEKELLSIIEARMKEAVQHDSRANNEVVQSLYIIDTPPLFPLTDLVRNSEEWGVSITLSLEGEKLTKKNGVYEKSILNQFGNMIAYPGLLPRSVKESIGIDYSHIEFLNFKEAGYYVDNKTGLALLDFIPVEEEKAFKQFYENLRFK
ncbi:hypothetical protein CVD28_02175 [Bacillus sp. M6-12]|uniref:hypothetical protein n=1 Tax=Bacillus sp. M6-12 TaxID=2054166 RepID=UPI000C789688|nr:hypothetical protein [Bacillus sp. M6-12]PLS19239.1 hypothetical protein CVD28_02175 [Bacillus sp. M6-12]